MMMHLPGRIILLLLCALTMGVSAGDFLYWSSLNLQPKAKKKRYFSLQNYVEVGTYERQRRAATLVMSGNRDFQLNNGLRGGYAIPYMQFERYASLDDRPQSTFQFKVRVGPVLRINSALRIRTSQQVQLWHSRSPELSVDRWTLTERAHLLWQRKLQFGFSLRHIRTGKYDYPAGQQSYVRQDVYTIEAIPRLRLGKKLFFLQQTQWIIDLRPNKDALYTLRMDGTFERLLGHFAALKSVYIRGDLYFNLFDQKVFEFRLIPIGFRFKASESLDLVLHYQRRQRLRSDAWRVDHSVWIDWVVPLERIFGIRLKNEDDVYEPI